MKDSLSEAAKAFSFEWLCLGCECCSGSNVYGFYVVMCKQFSSSEVSLTVSQLFQALPKE